MATETDISLSTGSQQYISWTLWDQQSKGISASSDDCLEKDFLPSDNPNNVISKEAEFWIDTVLVLVISPVLGVVGLVGNTLSALVFFRQGLNNRINMCLFCLAVVDLVCVIGNGFLFAQSAYRLLVRPIYLFSGAVGAFTWVSQLLSTVIASERCFCVVSPLKAKGILSTRKMAVFIGVSSISLLNGVFVIAGPKHNLVCVRDRWTNRTDNIIYVTSFYLKHKAIMDIFDVFIFSTALPAFFFMVITITSVITAYKLKKALQWRQQVSLSQPPSSQANVATMSAEVIKSEAYQRSKGVSLKEAALTRMLLVTSLLFVVCLAPNLGVQIAIFFVPDLSFAGRYKNLFTLLWVCISMSRTLNSSLHFFIYRAMGSKFRESLSEILSRHPCRKYVAQKQMNNPSCSPTYTQESLAKYDIRLISNAISQKI